MPLDLRRYPRVRIAGFRPAAWSRSARCATTGDLPAPPITSAPMLTTLVSRAFRPVPKTAGRRPAPLRQIQLSGVKTARAGKVRSGLGTPRPA